MKKFYIIFLLLISLIFLTTYSPNSLNINLKEENSFFEVKKIIITNNIITNKDNIEKELSNIYSKNIFLIKRKDIEKSLKKIDFVEKVEVKKKYPNTIIVKVFETKPVGIIFKDKKKYIIDNSSKLIDFKNDNAFIQLPKIFGEDAENNFIYFLKILIDNDFPTKKIKNFYYFQIGRWDLELLNGRLIKLPNNSDKYIIKKTIKLLNREDFKKYKIIDLRVDGKVIVE